MKDSVKWIITALSLALLITGAYLLYGKLQGTVNSGGLVVDMTDATEDSTDTTSGSDSNTESETTSEAPSVSDTTDDTVTTTEPAEESTSEIQEPTNPAPDFIVIDRNGNEVKLSDMRGKPVVINFWATWCGYCKLEMPDFEETYKKYGNDVHFMMVNMTDVSETVQKATAYVDGEGFSFPIYFDTKMSAAHAYSVSSLPASYFVDASGNLVARAISAIDAATIEQGINMILK